MWDPAAYLRYGDERARPFADLVGRIDTQSPATVVDLGCGPGNLTVGLAARWPDATISGIDSSAAMIDKATSLGSTVSFAVGDLREWVPDPLADVVISNATLHWIAGHEALLAHWASRLRPGSWLAFQVPGNANAASHQALRDLAVEHRWRDRLAHVAGQPRTVPDPTGYATLLRAAGCAVDAWETTYLHLLPSVAPTPDSTPDRGEPSHPVLEWMEGTALRPVRAALPDAADWASFREDLRVRLAQAYPERDGLVYFPFRRVFCVARAGCAG